MKHCAGISLKEGMYSISPQPDFDLLQEAWKATPGIRNMAESIELGRVAEDRSRNLDHLAHLPLLTARARYALLDGRQADFMQLYGRVRGLATVEWRTWLERLAFWEGVLGPHLSGADAIPVLPETQELRNLIYMRYAFHAPCPGCSIPFEQLPAMAKLGSMLKQRRLRPLDSEEIAATPGAAAASDAIAHMLGGDGAEAHSLFRKALGTRATIHYQLGINLGGPLLVYAAINAIQAHADEETINTWLNAAFTLLPPYCHPGKERDDLCGMLQSLRLYDRILNRNRASEPAPPLNGPLACFPLLLCYGQLPDDLRSQLPQETLKGIIQKLEHAGLALFSQYALESLLSCGALPSTFPVPPAQTGTASFRPLLQAHHQEESLWLAVRHELKDSPGHFLTPGEGEELIPTQTPYGPRMLRRNMKEERIAAQALWKQYPLLAQGEPQGFCRCRFKGMETILHALSLLLDGKAPLHWQGAALRLLPPPDAPLALTFTPVSAHWIELDAQLTSGGMSWPLADVLAAFRFRCGRYLPITKQRYLPMPGPLIRQITILAKYTQTKAHKAGISPAAMPALSMEYRESFPDGFPHCTETLKETAAPRPKGFKAKLLPYQKEGYGWLHARATAQLGACLADAKGLDKTIQMLALLLKHASEGPSLVIAPHASLLKWEKEACFCTPSLKATAFHPGLMQTPPQAGDIVLASYRQLAISMRLLKTIEWNIVALDEAEAIKNPYSPKSVAARKLRARVRFCLTETPIDDELMGLWSLMDFLNPGMLGTLRDFSLRYQEASPSSLAHLKRLVAPLVLRRTMASSLPHPGEGLPKEPLIGDGT